MRLSLLLLTLCSFLVACANFNAADEEMAIPEVSAKSEQPTGDTELNLESSSGSSEPTMAAASDMSGSAEVSPAPVQEQPLPQTFHATSSLPEKPMTPEVVPLVPNNGVPVASWDQHTAATKSVSYEDKPVVKKSKKTAWKNKKSTKIAKKDKKSKKDLAKHSKKSKKNLAKNSKSGKKMMAKNKAGKNKMAQKGKHKKTGKVARSESRSSYR